MVEAIAFLERLEDLRRPAQFCLQCSVLISSIMRKLKVEGGIPAKQRVTLYLTAVEKERVKELAGSLSLNEYFRRAGLRMKPVLPAPQLNREIYLQLSQIRTKLNQTIRACNRLSKQGSETNIDAEWLEELEDQVRQLQLQVLNPSLVDPTTNQ